MVSHSEISLAGSPKLKAAPARKNSKKRTRNAQPSKAAKRPADQKKPKQARKTKSNGAGVTPVMKFRAVDIVENGHTSAPKKITIVEDSTITASEEWPRILQVAPDPVPEASGSLPDMDFDAVLGDVALGEEGLEIEVPSGKNKGPLVTDPELLELLEQLSSTIDTASSFFDAATDIPAMPAQEGEETDPNPAPAPQPEPEPADPPPLAAQYAVPPPAERPARKKRRGIGILVNAALTGVILAAGAAWLAYTNPWLLNDDKDTPARLDQSVSVAPVKPNVPATADQETSPASIEPAAPAKLDRNASAAPVKKQNEPVPPDPILKSVAIAPVPGAVLASFSPPDDDPVPMETAVPPAPLPAAEVSAQISVAAGQSAPLSITLPATAKPGEISVMVQDVPKLVKLSAGKSLGAGNWLLDETHLSDLKLVTADGLAAKNYQLEVIFVRSDGKVPETRKVSLRVQPAGPKAASTPAASPTVKVKPAPKEKAPNPDNGQTTFVKTGVAVEIPFTSPKRVTPPAPAPEKASVPETPKIPKLSVSEVKAILARGNKLLKEGDIAGARLLLEYAATQGSKMAMVKLGESYDPKYLAELGARGVQPDHALAAHWYNRASAVQ